MLLEVHDLSKSFGDHQVLKDVSFSVEKGQIVCVLGPSGCGKSTLLKAIGALVEASGGRVENHATETAFIFQEARLLPWLTARENVEIVVKERIDDGARRRYLVDRSLKRVKLDAFSDYYPKDLSGGMKQRVAIARALVIDPQLLLMDEPLSNLDFPLRLELIALLEEIFEESERSGLFVTHDDREATLMGDRVMIMDKDPGEIRTVIEIDAPRKTRTLASPEVSEAGGKITRCLRGFQ
ncbi:MAG: ABC transporter ATP-binding protein, partial [Candidatus Acetothermia bacterium]